MSIPNLFVAGTSKAGTTAIYYYLSQHPDLFLPEKKELHFYSRAALSGATRGPGDDQILSEVPATRERYLEHYSSALSRHHLVDISPSYFHFPDVPKLIAEKCPSAKAVIVLRNPADKAFSQFMHLRSVTRETLEFRAALAAEPDRIRQGYSDMWHYRDSGFYSLRLRAWLDALGRENVRVYLFEELQREPLNVVRDICRFFGVSPDIDFKDPGQVNVSGLPKSKLVSKLLLRPNRFTWLLRRVLPSSLGRWGRELIRKLNAGKREEFPADLRAALLEGYAEDIREVEKILGRRTGWIS